jgi:hypothetical protein
MCLRTTLAMASVNRTELLLNRDKFLQEKQNEELIAPRLYEVQINLLNRRLGFLGLFYLFRTTQQFNDRYGSSIT